MARLDGKVAFITGAARGQGRSHAVRLASDGADIIAIDICANIPSNQYDLATPADLEETVRLVEKQSRRIVAAPADVRDRAGLAAVLDAAVAELGRLDIVVANAGIAPMSFDDDDAEGDAAFRAVIDVNLVGLWNTCRVSIPHLIAGATSRSHSYFGRIRANDLRSRRHPHRRRQYCWLYPHHDDGDRA